MTRNRYLAPLAALTLLATSAAPALAKAQDGEGNGSVAAKSEKKICKTFENTASRMKREKLCLTKAQWKKFDADNQ